jgi:DNA repair photolyase
MRWDRLSVEEEATKQLPGYREPATVRTFDAPEAMDIRFYEVHSKSVLNKVPKASRMPFRWTVNPYRGCTHACVYCLDGGTEILLADGGSKPLADIRPGDRVIGTALIGAQRRYIVTSVLDHWQTLKPAYRVTLADGTSLVASADHRFLARGGWRQVTGKEPGGPRRRLSASDQLLGPGRGGAPGAGESVGTVRGLWVDAVETLDEERVLFDITTDTGDFIANGVVSHNCFARPTHKYLDLSPGRDFEREIVVKVNAPEALRAQLSRPSWSREHVALGTNTDPYQWVEGRYRLMPGIWEALRDSGTPCSVLTKSPLLLRDVALLKELADRVGFTASLSVPTIDERAWRASEPHTPHPRARLEAVAELNRAGVPTGILVAPLMPGVNDAPEQVARILELGAEAGATSIGGLCLHLRGEVRGIFLDWLRGYRPDLIPHYEELYAHGAYAPKTERERIAQLARAPGRGNWRKAFRGGAPTPPPEEPAGPEQPSLF